MQGMNVAVKWVVLFLRIREVSISNLGLIETLCGFPQFFQVEAVIGPQTGSCRRISTSFRVHYVLIILAFEAIYSEVLIL
jgi:hypothetical protein